MQEVLPFGHHPNFNGRIKIQVFFHHRLLLSNSSWSLSMICTRFWWEWPSSTSGQSLSPIQISRRMAVAATPASNGVFHTADPCEITNAKVVEGKVHFGRQRYDIMDEIWCNILNSTLWAGVDCKIVNFSATYLSRGKIINVGRGKYFQLK